MVADAVASQQMLMQLYENSPIPYLLISPTGKIQLPNKAALRLFDATAENLEAVTMHRFFFEEDREKVNLLLARFQRHVSVNEVEIRIQRKDGTMRWVILSIYALRDRKDANGLVALVDITERKEVDRAKTEFVSLASHQLRTPLSAVKWYSELLISGDLGNLTEAQQKYVEKVHHGNERMIELVNMLLSVSRLELGTFLVEKKPIVVVDIIENILEELNSVINKKQLRIERQYGELPSVVTDPKIFGMVIQNLISNAVKYTPENGRVRVVTALNGSNLELIVEDSGMGIPKEQQSQIFTKLFRADNAREKESEGTGLGLYIVKAALERLGGSVSFTSEEDKGTAFRVILPL